MALVYIMHVVKSTAAEAGEKFFDHLHSLLHIIS